PAQKERRSLPHRGHHRRGRAGQGAIGRGTGQGRRRHHTINGVSGPMATPLASMTGYARAQSGVPGIGFSVEIKSVNGRGLDMRMRLTPGYDALEPEIRRRVGKAVT